MPITTEASFRIAMKDPSPRLISAGAGLYLRITKTGASWAFIMTRHGQRTDAGLGSAKTVSLALARTLAAPMLAAKMMGDDPLAGRKAARAAQRAAKSASSAPKTSVEKVGARFIETNASSVRASVVDRWEWLLANRVGDLAKMDVADVKPTDIADQLKALQKVAPTTAKEVQILIGRIFEHALAEDLIDRNPAIWRGGKLKTLTGKIGKKAENHPSMPWQQVPAFYDRLAKREETTAAAMRFVMLTATRKREALEIRWGEIDMDAAIWTLPEARSKTKTEHQIPLSTEALAILRAQIPGGMVPLDDRPVFVGQNGYRPLSSNCLADVLRREGADAYTTHGFRSSFRTWADDGEVDSELAERCLGHAVGNAVGRAYRRSNVIERRRGIMEAWADHITSASAR